MRWNDAVQAILYFGGLVALTPVLGGYLFRVLDREDRPASSLFSGLDARLLRLVGALPGGEMTWKEYAAALLVFNGIGFLALLSLELRQSVLPLNPQRLPDVPFMLALNTAVSFMTNTNWQSYAGESTMSRLTQMLGLGVQNFLSAATGLAVLLALARGLRRRGAATVGNFRVDVARATLYVLLPLSLMLGIALAGQGVVQSFAPDATVATAEGRPQVIPLGPAASQVAIKQLGTNGGATSARTARTRSRTPRYSGRTMN